MYLRFLATHLTSPLEASGKHLFFLYSYCFGKKLKLTHTHVCAVFVGFTPHIRSRVSDPVWYGPDPDPNSQDKPDSDPWIFFRPDPDPWIFLGRIRIQAKKKRIWIRNHDDSIVFIIRQIDNLTLTSSHAPSVPPGFVRGSTFKINIYDYTIIIRITWTKNCERTNFLKSTIIKTYIIISRITWTMILLLVTAISKMFWNEDNSSAIKIWK